MTQYLDVITAFGAVAVLAWLAALLYPRLIPACAEYRVDNRWQQAGLLALAIALSIGIAQLQKQGWLFPDDSSLLSALNRIVILAPVLAYTASRRSLAAVLVPSKHILRSLLIGTVFAVLGLAAYISSVTATGDPLTLAVGVQAGVVIEIAVRTVLHCLVAAMFLALVAGGWSARIALALVALAITATQVPALLESGFSAEWLGLLVTHVALVVGLLSAVLATRNVVWLWPVLAVLNLLQFHLG